MKERSYSKNRISSITALTIINLWMNMPIPLGKKQIKVSTRLLVMKIFKNWYQKAQKAQKAQNRKSVRCRHRRVALISAVG